jgi:thymidylate synthase (FAD)
MTPLQAGLSPDDLAFREAHQTRPDTPFARILDQGFVEQIDLMGDDRRCVAAARVSLRREQASLTAGDEAQMARDKGLLERLIKDRHTSPFEHAVFQFRVRAPIFVVRQWIRHRFSSYNEESARYTELEDQFYLPEQLRVRVGKAMDYRYEALPPDENREAVESIAAVYEHARSVYEALLAKGVAREHARMVLPVAQFTTFVWTVNALSLMNFVNLRNTSHAQQEIQAYAEALEGFFQAAMPWTHAAFRAHWGVSAIS